MLCYMNIHLVDHILNLYIHRRREHSHATDQLDHGSYKGYHTLGTKTTTKKRTTNSMVE